MSPLPEPLPMPPPWPQASVQVPLPTNSHTICPMSPLPEVPCSLRLIHTPVPRWEALLPLPTPSFPLSHLLSFQRLTHTATPAQSVLSQEASLIPHRLSPDTLFISFRSSSSQDVLGSYDLHGEDFQELIQSCWVGISQLIKLEKGSRAGMKRLSPQVRAQGGARA